MVITKQASPLCAPYSKWSDADLQKDTGTYVTNMDGVATFLPIQDKVTAYAQSVAAFMVSLTGAATRDKNAILAKNKQRGLLIEATISLGLSVAELADGDTTVLTLSGMPQRKVRQPYKPTVPTGLTLFTTPQEGTIGANWNDIKGKRLFFVAYTPNPLTEANEWTTVNSTKCTCVLNGLQSGQKVWVKIGVIGTDNQTIWGDAILSPYIP